MTVSPKLIRNTLGRHVQASYSGRLPLEWENTPPPQVLESGWVRLLVSVERIDHAGLNSGKKLMRGRVLMQIAIPRGEGTSLLDEASLELVDLLAHQDISGIRMGAAVFLPPRDEKGFHLLPLQVRFTMLENT